MGILESMSTASYNNPYRPPQVPPYKGYPQQAQPYNSQSGMPVNYAPQGYPSQSPQSYPPQGYPNQPQQPQKYNASYEHSEGFQTCLAVTLTIALTIFIVGLRIWLEIVFRR